MLLRIKELIKIVVILILLFPILVSIYKTESVSESYVSELDNSYIQIRTISKDILEFDLFFIARNSLGDPELRSTIYYNFGGESGYYIIGKYSPEWELTMTNNKTWWIWSLQKEYTKSWTIVEGDPFWCFPFEVFHLTVYLVTNSTFYGYEFSVKILARNFEGRGIIEDINYDQLPNYSSFPEFQKFNNCYKLDFNFYHKFEYQFMIVFLYIFVVLNILLAFFFVLANKSDSIQILIGLLVSSPVLFLTFRSTFAPDWLTLLDIFLPISTVINGIILFWIIIRKNRKRFSVLVKLYRW